MIYPTNEELQGREDAAQIDYLDAQLGIPTLRERLVSWLRVKLGIVDDRTKVIAMEQHMLEIFRAQNEALTAFQQRLDKLEQLAIENSRVLNLHHEVIKRWANGSATLRSLEDSHAKKLRREQVEAAKERLRGVERPLQVVFDGEDGG